MIRTVLALALPFFHVGVETTKDLWNIILSVLTLKSELAVDLFYLSLAFWNPNYSTDPSLEKQWAKAISKSELRHRLHGVWTSTYSHSGQTAVLQRSTATLPVATYPVSCFPQSVVMRVIPHLRGCVGTVLWPPRRLQPEAASVRWNKTQSRLELFAVEQTGFQVKWGFVCQLWESCQPRKAPGARAPVKRCSHANVWATVRGFDISGV